MKLLSIAIPCYNSQDYMENCIESLLVGGEEVEILIVDDGSSDRTAEIADDYARKYPTIVKAIHQENGGHGEAAAPVDPMEAIQKEMNQFKPAIRDAVITNLSSKTSTELATAAGKELAKEQITNDINSILGGEREVLRVSFGQFIIQ